MVAGALDGVRVLDLSRVLAGPWASQTLADLGAEVLKIEHPRSGDDTRGWGPPWVGRPEDGVSAYFASTNRNKRSIAIDLQRTEGRALVQRLAASADVVLENFKVGGAAKLGLDYPTLSAVNPRLIYASITGFGQTGPDADHPGYDFVIQGLSGLMSLTGDEEPTKVGVALTDVLTGLYAAVGVLAALQERERSGLGQYLDVALFDVTVASMANQSLNYLASGVAPERMGNAHPNIVPYQCFATADGYLTLGVGNDGQFARLAALVGRPDWATDPRYATNAARVGHRDALIPQLDGIFATRRTEDWLEALSEEGIPAGAVQDLSEAFGSPQAVSRGLRQSLTRADGSQVPTVASPLRLSRTPATARTAPPRLGEHSREVLREVLGVDDAELERLIAAGVVRD
ncbi:MAG: CoA transferase [Deltaproteobacteria bacterium]|nr:CoA transferase [Deltaproteobacteria bacterium]